MTAAPSPRILVLGAGIAGLLAAQDLQAAGASVTVIDKARGVGGRMATRRIGDGGAVADHGAQFFTARSEAFAAELAGWLADGVAVPWFTGALGASGVADDDGELRYRGHPTMTAIAKHLARELPVRLATRAIALGCHDDGWRIRLEAGAHPTEGARAETMSADAVVLTAPAPQLLDLIEPAVLDPVDRLALEAIAYQPCVAAMIATDRSDPLGLAPIGARRPSGEPVAWLADNQVKGTSPHPCLTIHAGPTTSLDLWDCPDQEVAAALATAVGLDLRAIESSSVQRWRYAQASRWNPEPHLALRTVAPAVVAGDAFGDGGRVEGAAMSGIAAAAHLVQALGLG